MDPLKDRDNRNSRYSRYSGYNGYDRYGFPKHGYLGQIIKSIIILCFKIINNFIYYPKTICSINMK